MNNNDFINAYELAGAIRSLRYISMRWGNGSAETHWIDRDAVLSFIFGAPPEYTITANYGKWEHDSGDEWKCSVCGNVIYTEGGWEKPSFKYCFECGAKMEIDNND